MGLNGFVMVYYQNLLMQLRQLRRNTILILMPIVIFFFVYLFFNFNEVSGDFLSPIRMSVIDYDDTTYSDMLVESFKNNESFSKFVEIVEGDEAYLLKAFDDHQVDVLVLVPVGFVEGLSNQDALPLTVNIHYDDPVKAILFKNVIQSYEAYVRAVQTGVIMIDDVLRSREIDNQVRYSYRDRALVNLIFTALARNDYFDYKPILNVPTVIAVKYYFIALMVMFLMYMSIFASVNLIREKRDLCLMRLVPTSINMVTYILAKALAISTYMVMVITLWWTLFTIFYGPLWTDNYLFIIGFLWVCVFFDVALALFFTVFFEQEEPVILLSSIFIFFNAVIGGSIIPIHNMSYVMTRLANYAPNYWMIKGFLYLDHGYQLKEIGLVALVLSLVSFGMVITTGLIQSREVRS